MRTMAEHLAPGGLAVVDVWLPDAEDLARYDGRLGLEYVRRDPETGPDVDQDRERLHDAAPGPSTLTAIFDEGRQGEPANRWIRHDRSGSSAPTSSATSPRTPAWSWRSSPATTIWRRSGPATTERSSSRSGRERDSVRPEPPRRPDRRRRQPAGVAPARAPGERPGSWPRPRPGRAPPPVSRRSSFGSTTGRRSMRRGRTRSEQGLPWSWRSDGDGTVAALTADLAGTGIPLAIVPCGTGNVLAAALRIPNDPSRAIRGLAAGVRRSIDLGAASLPGSPGGPPVTRLFAVAAGVGWDARVMAATGGPNKQRLGRLAYWVAAFGLLGEMRPVPYVIEIDGRRLELDATVALVANAGELVPGLVRPRLPIVPDDGLLDLLVLRVRSVSGGVRGALELLNRTELGGSPSGEAFRARGERIRIAPLPDQPRQVDGDDLGSGPLEARVRAAALDVIAPPVDP